MFCNPLFFKVPQGIIICLVSAKPFLTKREREVVERHLIGTSVEAIYLETFRRDDFRWQIMDGIAATSFLVLIRRE
jgi:hypothetical protein